MLLRRRIRCSPTPSSASAPRRIRRRSTASSPSSCRTAQLVVANGWIEGLTVASIILGTVLGGVLIHAKRLGRAAALRLAVHRHRHRHAGRGGDRRDRRGLRHRRAVQPRIRDTGVTLKPLPARSARHARASSRTASRTCGATSWARSRSPSPRCSGAPARRCSSSSSSGRAPRSASTSPRPRSCRAWSRSASRSARCSPRCCVSLDRSVRVMPLGIAMGLVVHRR